MGNLRFSYIWYHLKAMNVYWVRIVYKKSSSVKKKHRKLWCISFVNGPKIEVWRHNLLENTLNSFKRLPALVFELTQFWKYFNFLGTLNPALQDRHGQPKRDITTIIHILNDLLCAQYKNYQTSAKTKDSATATSSSATATAAAGSAPSTATTATPGPRKATAAAATPDRPHLGCASDEALVSQIVASQLTENGKWDFAGAVSKWTTHKL